MKSGFIILFSFLAGVVLAYFKWIPSALLETDYSVYILYALMFFVGISIGANIKELYQPLMRYRMKIVLVPVATIAGTLLSCLALGLLFNNITLRETVAIGAGFGYYSFSAIYLKELAGAEIGMMALVANLFREIFTLLCTPLLVKYFGNLAPITSAGATSIDTSLPIITRYSGQQFVVISLFHGVVVDISVPLILSLLYLF